MGRGKKVSAWFESLSANSAIIRFSKRCYNAMLSGFFGSHMTNYSTNQNSFEKSSIGQWRNRKASGWQNTALGRARRGAIVSYENSRIVTFISGASRWLRTCYLKMYGFFFLYFGLCTLLMNLVKRFALSTNMSSSVSWYVGALMLCISAPMLFSEKTFTKAIDDSFMFSFLVYKIFGFSRAEMLKHSSEGSFGGKRYFAAALAGSLFGIVTFKISPLLIVAGIMAVLLAALVYTKPEIGMLLIIISMPFLSFIGGPSILLALLILFVFVCSAAKAFLGRLALNFEISDLFVALFLLVMLFGGIISFGGAASLREASVYVCLLLGYFLFVTIISSREWLSKCAAALVVSGAGTALYGLYQKFAGNLEVGTMDKEMFSDLGGRITSTFENSNMLGVFLVMLIPFAFALALRMRGMLARLFYLACAGTMGICLIYTWSRGAWLGLLFACLVFVLLYNHYFIPLLIPGAALGITLLWNKLGGSGFVTQIVGRFSSIVTMTDSSSVYRLGIWRGAFRILGEYWFTGIGIGAEAFRTVYIRNAESGIEAAVHSHNLFLQIMIETGLIGLVIFICAIVLCIKSGLEIIRYSSFETGFEKAIAVSGISGLSAALLQGMSDFIWFNYRIYFLFWLVAAFVGASARIARRHGACGSDEYDRADFYS